MVATALRNVRGRLCQRSDPEPIGCSAESNQPHVIPLGADNSCYKIAGFWSPVIASAVCSISIRETALPGDVADETHSAWTLELVGVSGKICTVSWRTFRKWNESRVVLEHHYDHQQSGEPLTHDDLRFDALEPAIGFQRPS